MFNEEEKLILSVRSGITDWASLWNRDEGKALAETLACKKAYLERLRATKLRLLLTDGKASEASFVLDLSIIIQGILARLERTAI